MKKHLIRIGLAVLFVAAPLVAAAATDDSTAIELGAGVVISPDYGSLLEDVYRDADSTGIGGWLDLHGGVRLKVNDQFSITPTLGLLLNYVIVTGGRQDESYLNSIIVPSVAARYSFDKAPSLYIGGEVNYNIPNTGSDYYEFESGGVGFGGVLGYAFEGDMNLELGYVYLPVEVGSRDENLGGFLFRIGIAL